MAIMPWQMPAPLYPAYDILARSARLVLSAHHALHGEERFRPVMIVGSGRSGNTLLRRILQAGPDLHIPPETFVLGRAIRLFLRNRQMPWDHLVRLVMSLFEFHREAEKFETSLRPLVQELLRSPPPSRNLAAMLNAFYRFHGNSTGKTFTRWGDKTPLNTFSLDLIVRVFPDARFVHVLRDGVDVACSYVASGLQPDFEAAARRWVRSVSAVRAFAGRRSAQCYEIRYEDLVADPAEVVSRLCDYLEITFDPSMIERLDHVEQMGDVARYAHLQNVAGPISTASVGRGRRTLDPSLRRMLKRVLDSELLAWGYEPID